MLDAVEEGCALAVDHNDDDIAFIVDVLRRPLTGRP
jgi:hypothetical protein